MVYQLIIPAFVAGLLTFLAPCTFPLVPGFIGLISGYSKERSKIFLNAVMYVLGFSLVFILLGTLFGLGGVALAKYRFLLARIGGVLVILFGLYMIGLFRLPLFKRLSKVKRLPSFKWIKPGYPSSSFIFGVTFALGWTPCVGPILGSILLLASTSQTVGQGAFLLFVFSLGLALPFLLIASALEKTSAYVKRLNSLMKYVSFIGGVFLIFLGVLLVTDNLGIWFGYAYGLFDFLNYEALLDYL